MQGLQGEEVGADVFADGGVWAAAGFDGADAVLGEGFVAGEEFGVFSVCGCWLDLGAIEVHRYSIKESHLVKISFVTAAMLYSSRSARLNASIRAVFPDPTGLVLQLAFFQEVSV